MCIFFFFFFSGAISDVDLLSLDRQFEDDRFSPTGDPRDRGKIAELK